MGQIDLVFAAGNGCLVNFVSSLLRLNFASCCGLAEQGADISSGHMTARAATRITLIAYLLMLSSYALVSTNSSFNSLKAGSTLSAVTRSAQSDQGFKLSFPSAVFSLFYFYFLILTLISLESMALRRYAEETLS